MAKKSGDNESKVLEKAIDDILKTYGEGAIQKTTGGVVTPVDSFSTGSIGLDIAIGVGGVPRGRITEIVGEESTGKSTICLNVVKSCQIRGLRAAYIDHEQALDLDYAQSLGVDTDDLYLSQPGCGEQGLDIAQRLMETGEFGVVVFDSIAAMSPKSEMEGEFGDSTMGAQARMMSQALRKMSVVIRQQNVATLFTNQYRSKIGVMFGDPRVPTGGNAMKFWASVRLDMSKSVSAANLVKDGDEVLGNLVTAKVFKNKVSAPFKKAEFDILYGSGVNRNGELLTIGQRFNIVVKRGAFFSYGDTRLGQGFVNACEFLKQNDSIAKEIETKILSSVKSGEILVTTEDKEDF